MAHSLAVTPSPFLLIPESAWIAHNDLAFAIRDKYEVSPGHTLVIPKRLVVTWFEATLAERDAVMRLVEQVKEQLDREQPTPDGYNIGFNVGEAAGQTVMHLHVHVIPRYRGDMDDPRGGVRGVIPERQKYGGIAPPVKRVSPFATHLAFTAGQEQHLGPMLRRGLQHATEVDIVAAFVQPTGIAYLLEDLRDALDRGVRVRVLTGDYCNTTSPDALRQLLSLETEYPILLSAYLYRGGGSRSFHAKCYLFLQGDHGIAYVGSSNLSSTALTHGIEWNLRAITSQGGAEFQSIRSRFEHLLRSPFVVPLTREVVDAYAKLARIPEGPEPRSPAPAPHVIQSEALEALRKLRNEEETAGLVVLATGLGKTYLGALDFKQQGGARALFIAHRDEILAQAHDSWERLYPDKVLGFLTGEQKDATADVVFASIQTLSRKRQLETFAPEHFDYIVVDEFHHASAGSYRRVLGYFRPRFLLGLTATPDRMDGASILELCHDNIAYRAGLMRGITSKLLVPFRYYGIKDEVDFENIPWRGRWPVEELTAAVATQGRAEQALREYERHAAVGKRRTVAFCCSVAHADFMAEFFLAHGISAASVHSGPSSAPRAESLRKLRAGALEVLCAVDIFNEGLDVPDINVVLMLRPTESPTVFLQQLGRGLRRAEHSDKSYLTIVDFIGNHRSFLVKPQALVALTDLEMPAATALAALRSGDLALPEGCLVDIETEAIDMLERLSRLSKEDALVYEYVALRDSHGRRPTAAEVYATGVHMKPVRERHASWFDFVNTQDDLSDDERQVLQKHSAWFSDLMTTKLQRSYKMVTLRVLLERDALRVGDSVGAIAEHAHHILRDDLLLRQELEEHERADRTSEEFMRMWREMPLRVWAEAKSTSTRWFTLDGQEFRFMGKVSEEDGEVFDQMTAELVELRLAEHRSKLRANIREVLAPIRLRVSHVRNRPILRFDRAHQSGVPAVGDVPVKVDGETYLFGFRQIAVNSVTRAPGGTNELPSLMKRWFGAKAGQPGSRHYVSLTRHAGEWILAREDDALRAPSASISPLPELPFFSDPRVACDAYGLQDSGHNNEAKIRVRNTTTLSKKHFVVRASGDSMEGGAAPIRDGDLVLCEWLPPTSVQEVVDNAVLVAGYVGATISYALLAVIVPSDAGWQLHSWNPAVPDQPVPADATIRPLARVVEVVEEAAGPVLWGNYDREAVVGLFGLKNDRSWQVGHRDIEVLGKGHSILFVKLRKPPETPASQRYADRFESPSDFQWESQASTTPENKRGRSIIEQHQRGQTIHLFCRYTDDDPFIYCGTLQYVRHQGSKPIRVWFKLDHPLPDSLWRLWAS